MKTGVAGKNAPDLLAPLRAAPDRSAIALDVDGTLAPVVPRPQDASAPAGIREVLIELQARYALVACISGRRAEDARRVVGIDSLDYVGNHGLERLRPNSTRAETQPEAEPWRDQVRSFATSSYGTELRDAGVTLEDKDVIWSFHWREAHDEGEARAALEQIAAATQSKGLVSHWGRKVLEIRPPLPFDKGSALERLLDDRIDLALYAGDDRTDLDAFKKLRGLRSSGRLSYAVCVGVVSDEGPPEIAAQVDLTVEGAPGVRQLLVSLI
jgi:trehalose 6-phosphate phosphatase